MLKFHLISIILFTAIHLQAQTYSITGYVTDSASGERIIGANVVDLITNTGASTNSYGFFDLKISGPKVKIVASYVGSLSPLFEFIVKHDTLVMLSIHTTRELTEVIVETKSNAYKRWMPLGMTVIPVKSLTLIPSLGEPDVLKSIQSQPGVKGGLEGSAGIYVRGGGNGENLFLLDDVPIYNVSHLYGFFSAFNSQSVKDLKVVKGCFPARYGGRASSVIDVRSIDGNNKQLKGAVSIGLISSQITLHGPLLSEKTTFMVAARRSYFDLLAKPLKDAGALNKNFPDYFFYDMNAKLAHAFSSKDKLYFNFYSGKDHMKNEDEFTELSGSISKYTESNVQTSGWGNTIASGRWNHLFGSSLFVNTTLAYSTYNYFTQTNFNATNLLIAEQETTTRSYFANYKSNIDDLIAKVDFDYGLSNNHTLKFGFGNIYHKFNPGNNHYRVSDEEMNSFSDTAYANKILYGNEFYIYFEGHLKLNQKLLADMGVRFTGMQSREPAIWNAEPRVSINYLLTPDLVIKTGYSRMNQYMHLLSSAGVSMPTDIWVPALKGIKPLQSDQVNIGLTYNWNEKAFFSFEIYQKWMHHTTDLANGSSIASDMTPWFDKVVQGTGSSKGIELLVEKQFGDLKGMISYTLSKSTRQYDSLNYGNPFRFRYDRLNDLSISLKYQISKHWDVSALWVLGSGYPVTLPVSKYSAGIIIHNNDSDMGGVVYDYPSKNNYTLPVYHRLDLGVHYNNTNRWWQYTWSIDIFNVYNRKNPVYLYYSNNYPKSFKYGSFLPMIPTISYLLKF